MDVGLVLNPFMHREGWVCGGGGRVCLPLIGAVVWRLQPRRLIAPREYHAQLVQGGESVWCVVVVGILLLRVCVCVCVGGG